MNSKQANHHEVPALFLEEIPEKQKMVVSAPIHSHIRLRFEFGPGIPFSTMQTPPSMP
jgi:hypothetical protein